MGNTMKSGRRQFLLLVAGTAALPAISRIASAETYPSRPIRLIVGYPPGGTADIIARLTAQTLSERLSQKIIVENRPGANGNIATETVVRAPADGYTILLEANPNVISAMITPNLDFNIVSDIAPVAGICLNPLIMEVNPAVPVKTVPEFIAYAKAHPGTINMASGGTGSTPHLGGELFKMMTGIDMLHVPYHGDAPAIADLIAGQDQIMFDMIIVSLAHVRSGTLRALAVTSLKRLPTLPDLPPVADFVPGYEAYAWQGIGAPKGTPVEIIDKLNQAITAGLDDPTMKARIADLGAVPMPMTPAAFGKLIANEIEKWGKVIKFAGIKAG
jgi:tripartite-type tricarboxylate transporter receptor subunit TctC